MPPCFRSARGGELAFGEEGLLAADRTHEDGRLPLRAEYVNREIRFGNVHQPAWLQADALEGLHVALQREVVFDACGHVAPVRRRQRATRRFLEVHDLEEVLCGRRNRVVRRDELPGPYTRGGRDNRARGDEQQEFAAILR